MHEQNVIKGVSVLIRKLLKHEGLKGPREQTAGQPMDGILTFDPASPSEAFGCLKLGSLRDLDIRPRFLPFYTNEKNYSLRSIKEEYPGLST